MRFIIELPTSKAQAIKSLIDSGKYEGMHSFILTAIENQIYIERRPLEQSPPEDFVSNKSLKESGFSSSSSLASQPELASPDIVRVEDPQPEAVRAESLWALHNRIFPIKITVRVLLNILKSNPPKDGYIDLRIVQDAALEEARRLGRILSQVDKKSHRMHGEKLSAGLPGAGERSSDRFKLNFVGLINSKNHLDGAPAILRFVNMRRNEEGEPQIGITESGSQFALLENPILDKADYTRVLSQEESDFYVRHIAEKLQKEHLLSVSVLKAIEDGHITPDELTRVVIEANPNIKREEAQAIRSSLASRLSELGFLRRKRLGLNVTYALTSDGYTLLTPPTNIEKQNR